MERVSTFDLRRGNDRACTATDLIESRHSFAFGPHYQPDNLGFGPLLAHNEDVLRPGPGYQPHAHRDTEILTWVLAGSLLHEDQSGERTVISAGQLQYLSAGSGIRHTERSAAAGQPVHLVQMWLSPDTLGGEPDHRHLEVAGRLRPGELVPVASGLDRGPDVLRLRRRDATLSVARLDPGNTLRLPVTARVHLFVARGRIEVAGAGSLQAGDALRVTGSAGTQLAAVEAAELLVWEFSAPD